MFLDRALIVLPVVSEKDVIPDEKYANLVRAPLHTSAGIHPRSASWPLDVISMVVGRPGEQVIQTIDPRLTTLGFPVYPPLPAATDCNRIEEIRRTVLVTNLDPKVTGEEACFFHVFLDSSSRWVWNSSFSLLFKLFVFGFSMRSLLFKRIYSLMS